MADKDSGIRTVMLYQSRRNPKCECVDIGDRGPCPNDNCKGVLLVVIPAPLAAWLARTVKQLLRFAKLREDERQKMEATCDDILKASEGNENGQ